MEMTRRHMLAATSSAAAMTFLTPRSVAGTERALSRSGRTITDAVQRQHERLATGMRWCEGPVYFGDARCLIWSDIPNNRLMRYDEVSGAVSVYREPSNHANGNRRDRQGRLVTCEHETRRWSAPEYSRIAPAIWHKRAALSAALCTGSFGNFHTKERPSCSVEWRLWSRRSGSRSAPRRRRRRQRRRHRRRRAGRRERCGSSFRSQPEAAATFLPASGRRAHRKYDGIRGDHGPADGQVRGARLRRLAATATRSASSRANSCLNRFLFRIRRSIPRRISSRLPICSSTWKRWW